MISCANSKGWLTLATEATEAELESEESSDLVWNGTTEATEAEAESKKKKLFWSFWLRFRRASDSASDSSFWFTLDRNAPCASDSDSASDSVASVNQP